MTSRFARLLAPFLVCLAAVCQAAPTQEEVNRIYRELVGQVKAPQLKSKLETIAGFGSRLAGSSGEAKTFDYVERRFRELGLTNIRREPFTVTVPNPEATGTFRIGGSSVTVYPLWPNLVRTSTCDVEGRVVYGGDGSLEAFNGKDIRGSIVVLEFDTGSRWRNAMKLGAKAIVFLEPLSMSRGDAELKFASVPVNAPRFYLPADKAGPVLAAAAAGQRARLTCRQDWVTRTSYNLLADLPGTDASAKAERVLLMAYADSMSLVPKLAPGAEATVGVGALLTAAEIYKRKPGRRPVTFLLSGAHHLSLQGAREFMETRLEGDRMPTIAAVTLDMSSGSSTLASYGRGWYYEYRDETQRPISNFSRLLRSHADQLFPIIGQPNGRLTLTDAVNNSDSRTWKNNIPSRFAFDCEPLTAAGYNAYTFATIEDSRERVDTPFDTFDRVNVGNAVKQTQTLVAMLHHLLNDTSDRAELSNFRVPLDVRAPSRMRLTGGFGTLTGYVAVYDLNKSFVPDVRVPGSLAVVINEQRNLMGVRGSSVQEVMGEEARYKIPGQMLINGYATAQSRRMTAIGAFHLDKETGDIDHSVDFGLSGWEFDTYFELKTTSRESPMVVFPCDSIDFYDLVDPQELRSLMDAEILDAETNGEPQNYGMFLSWDDMRLNSEIEDMAVIFTPPGARVKLLFGTGLGENRLILTNSSKDNLAGVGYTPEGGEPVAGRRPAVVDGVFQNTALNAAHDIVAINDGRIAEFQKYRIISRGVIDLQEQAKKEIREAELALERRDWSAADRHSRAAWGLALRAHPVVMKTASDVVNGVVFYLFLIIPFSYFIERLFFGHRSLTKQLSTGVVVFMLAFLLLRYIHPAFELVTNPLMIFVAFVMGVLSVLVIFFIIGKFESALKETKQAETGLHEVDMRRSSVALAAFNLGVSNMRRRKARTLLTTLTLVVMTFIVLSFTSIVPEIQISEQASDNEARYAGLLIRNPGLEPLQSATFRQLQNEFRERGEVARRATYYGADIGDVGVLTLQRNGLVAELRVMLGLDPAEANITSPDDALLPGGRWFRPGEEKVMILPQPVADALKIGPNEVGTATVTFGGEAYTVIGILDSAQLRGTFDLDGDGILPPDFSLSRQYQQVTSQLTEAFRSFIRLDPSVVFIVPAETALNAGADLRTLAVGFDDPSQVRPALEALMPRLRLNLYAGVQAGDELEVKQFSIQQGSKGTGMGLVIVQLLIAAVFVLNTMIATVYERTKEIAIFSSIGLAPNHIAMLFFAESLVYGVLGSVFGYFAAQIAAKVIIATNTLPGLYLNFSSGSAVLSAGLVMGVVLGSTIYPARKAAQIAAPAQREEAFETEPEGDVWRIPLPFSVSEAEAAPLVEFLGEWLRAYEEYTIGDFVTSGTRMWTDGEGTYKVETTAWLAPYDLGVSQDVQLIAQPSQVVGVYVLDLQLTRLAGEGDNWMNVNDRFLANLRKQFLTWRTLTTEQRRRYVEQAQVVFGSRGSGGGEAGQIGGERGVAPL